MKMNDENTRPGVILIFRGFRGPGGIKKEE